jgi:hypothetical protein
MFFCRRQYIESAREAVLDVCRDWISTTGCIATEDGRYCQSIPSYSFRRLAAAACANTSECDPLCLQTLNNATNVMGCCFISRFNDTTEPQRDWMTYKFWQQCGLTSPGFCEELINEAVSEASILRISSLVVPVTLLIVYALIMK